MGKRSCFGSWGSGEREKGGAALWAARRDARDRVSTGSCPFGQRESGEVTDERGSCLWQHGVSEKKSEVRTCRESSIGEKKKIKKEKT
ncbi:hypothetical protein ACFX1X_038324 [Malus domestica]